LMDDDVDFNGDLSGRKNPNGSEYPDCGNRNLYIGYVGSSWNEAQARHAVCAEDGNGDGSAENQLFAGENESVLDITTSNIWQAGSQGEINEDNGNMIIDQSGSAPQMKRIDKSTKFDNFKEYLTAWQEWYNGEMDTDIDLVGSKPQRMTIVAKGVDENSTPTFGPGQSHHNVEGEFRDHNFYDEDLQVITFDFAAHDPPGQGNNPKWGEWNAFGDGNNQLRITPENEEATIVAGFFDNAEDDIRKKYFESLNGGGSGGGTGSWSYAGND